MSCNCANLRLNAAGYPFTWASNYGGRIQFNTMPSYVTAAQAMRIQANMTGANMFAGCSGYMPMMPTMPMMPQVTMPGVYPQTGDPSTVQGYIDGRKTRIGVIANQSAQNLTASQAELQALVNDPSVTDAQKKEINKYLTQIQKIQTELQQAVQQAQMANSPEMLDQINMKVEALAGMAQELQGMIPEMLRLLIAEAEQVTEPTETEEPQQTQGDIQVIAPEGTNPDESLITTTNKHVSPEVRDITEKIYDAVNGPGTKDGQLKDAVDKINKDNVLDVFDNWNASYAPGYINDDNKGLIETIYDDKSLWYNGGKEEVSHIVEALVAKAADFGDEAIQAIQPLKAEINSELNAWFNTDEDKVAEAVNKMVLILTAFQAEHANTAPATEVPATETTETEQAE